MDHRAQCTAPPREGSRTRDVRWSVYGYIARLVRAEVTVVAWLTHHDGCIVWMSARAMSGEFVHAQFSAIVTMIIVAHCCINVPKATIGYEEVREPHRMQPRECTRARWRVSHLSTTLIGDSPTPLVSSCTVLRCSPACMVMTGRRWQDSCPVARRR
jgi:hypothetical protein